MSQTSWNSKNHSTMICSLTYLYLYAHIKTLIYHAYKKKHIKKCVWKKKDAPFFSSIKQIQKMITTFLMETFLTIFKRSFNLNQSQVFISNGLGARAFQRESLFAKMHFLYRNCKNKKAKFLFKLLPFPNGKR